jgi:hypothetical protein
MKVMVIVHGTPELEATPPSPEVFKAMGNFNEELVNAGIMLAGEGLHPGASAKRVRFSKRGTTVIDGPFAEAKEWVAGFWIWKVQSMDEAIAWARRIPNPDGVNSEVELRQVHSADDLADVMPPETREQEARLRERLENPKS